MTNTSARLSAAIGSLMLIALLASCGPPKPIDEVGAGVSVYDLGIAVDHQHLTVSWKIRGDGLMSGYNIYISERPVDEGTSPYNEEPFPGDTDPADGVEIYEVDGLENGVKYHVAVAAVYADGRVSEFTPSQIAVCGGRGEIALDIRYAGDNDGFSFARNEIVRADSDDNDIYYYSADGADFLASPIRLSGFIRDTKMAVLPYQGDYDDVAKRVAERPVEPSEGRIAVKKGSWILARTADDGYVLLNVLGFSGSGEERRVNLWYAYSPLTGEVLFTAVSSTTDRSATR